MGLGVFVPVISKFQGLPGGPGNRDQRINDQKSFGPGLCRFVGTAFDLGPVWRRLGSQIVVWGPDHKVGDYQALDDVRVGRKRSEAVDSAVDLGSVWGPT